MNLYKSSLLFRIFRAICLSFFLLIVLTPFIVVFIKAFNLSTFCSTRDLSVILDNYKWLFEHVEIGTGLKNSMIRSVVVPLFTTLFTFCCAYAFIIAGLKARMILLHKAFAAL